MTCFEYFAQNSGNFSGGIQNVPPVTPCSGLGIRVCVNDNPAEEGSPFFI